MQNEILIVNQAERDNVLLKNVYSNMAVGLILTALVSYFTSKSAMVMNLLFTNPIMLIVLFVAQIGLVITLSAKIRTLEKNTALGLFLAYSVLNGLTLSSIFVVFTSAVIYKAFFSAAIMFVGASLYSINTKRNISAMGRYLSMGLFGLIGASFLNIFFYSSLMDFGISIFGVVLFMGLTIFDTKKIHEMSYEYGSVMTAEELSKIGVMGALTLYLDFINIFLYLLRIFARSND